MIKGSKFHCKAYIETVLWVVTIEYIFWLPCLLNITWKMNAEIVEVVSRENIKPSSPTPPHLQLYRLSYLDQICPPVFIPLVYLYPQDPGLKLSNTEISTRLKKSLSESLTRFYPLAGRVKNHHYVECSDEGVPYVEAQAHFQLVEVVKDSISNKLDKFFPNQSPDVGDLLMIVQVTFFDCGGMMVSIGVSHKIADANSILTFVKSWAATARGDTNAPSPRFEAASLFPPIRDTQGTTLGTGSIKDGIVTKRFLFTASKIADLRDKYQRRPSRIVMLSTFIWTRLIAATLDQTNKICVLLLPVNLRPRFDPPLSDYYFGNMAGMARVASFRKSDQEDCNEMANQVTDAISKMSDSIALLKQGEKHFNRMKAGIEKGVKGEAVYFTFSSYCRFPLYESDFGWGKPIWIGLASRPFKNLVIFTDTRSDEGIEACVSLKSEDMAKFEMDKELLEFVSPSPDAN